MNADAALAGSVGEADLTAAFAQRVPVPAQLAALTELSHLRLYNNTLSGTVPAQLAALTELGYLDLYDNERGVN